MRGFKFMQGIQGKSENDDMMIRFHHCLMKLMPMKYMPKSAIIAYRTEA